MAADPALLEVWLKGWALARGKPEPVHDCGALRVDVGEPDQQTRYVFAAPSEAVTRLAEAIAAPAIHLKLCATPDEVRDLLPPGWAIARQGWLMTLSPIATRSLTVPAGYNLQIRREAGVQTATIFHDDVPVARGGVVRVDDTAIFDRIEVDAAHRRRGLATALMQALAAGAGGAQRGALVATDEGRRLYEALGWTLVSSYVTATHSSR